jgi:hypothetical protein
VWSKNYNGTLANIFDLQESFARANCRRARGAAAFAWGCGAFKSAFSQEDFATIYRGAYGNEAARHAGPAIVAAHPHGQFAASMLLMLHEPEQSFATFERGMLLVPSVAHSAIWRVVLRHYEKTPPVVARYWNAGTADD